MILMYGNDLISPKANHCLWQLHSDDNDDDDDDIQKCITLLQHW